MISNHK